MMKSTSAVTTALLMVLITAFPSFVLPGSEAVGTSDVTPPTRYGFTPQLYTVATLSQEAICVDTGNIDGTNNDDIIIGMNGAVQIYKNNGGTGSFTLQQTLSLTGYYITKVDVSDWDNDADQDIIALGQEYYSMDNDAGLMDPTIGSLMIYYIKNNAGTFIVDKTYELTDALYYQNLWYWWDGVFDIAVGDIDKDNDGDTVLFYVQDTDGDANTGGERIRLIVLSYAMTGLSLTQLESLTYNVIAQVNCQVELTDMDEDGYLDLIYAYGGLVDGGGSWLQSLVRMKWHSGSGLTYGSPVDLDPTSEIPETGTFGTMPFALAIGNFAGSSLPDVAISTNRNKNTNPSFADTGIWMIRNKASRTFDTPKSTYTEDFHFMMRGMDVGDFDKEGGDDIIGFTKQDQTGDPDPYDGIDGYGVSIIGSRIIIPYSMYALKVYETPATMAYQKVKGVAVGNFDNDAEDRDDIVYVGSRITVGLTTFPPNNPPSMVRFNVNPRPVENNNNTATINITVEDLDGSWDLTKLEVAMTTIGLKFVSIEEPVLDAGNETIGYYEFQVIIPPTVQQGDYEIRIGMFDNCIPNYEEKSNDTFTLRVKQYNRVPEIALENKTLTVLEDTVTYFEGVYGWFYDQDILDALVPDLMNISMKSFTSNSWAITNTENEMFRVELVNGSASNPQDWALRITPKPNKFHTGMGGQSEEIKLKAIDPVDEDMESEILTLKVNILSVNDLPVIHLQGKPDDDFEFMLDQDDPGSRYLLASDDADSNLALNYYFEYENEEDADWLICDIDGKVVWKPKNENVGSHKITLWVSDGIANVSQVLWFNVSNVLDPPYFVAISNASKRVELPKEIHGRYEFVVYEHEEFNLTIEVDDADRYIGMQSKVNYQCNLTMMNNTYLDVDKADPFKAHLHFWAEKKYGYFATYEPKYPPLDTEIIITDEKDQDIRAILPIRVIIINVNDPPVFVSIDKPEEGFTSPILYRIPYSAGEALDPDTIYEDNLTYQWDFDASDGFQPEAEGLNGFWDFDRAGSYTITLRVMDTAGNILEATTNVSVSGLKNDKDYDNDGLPNEWEDENGFNKYDPSDSAVDSDGDDVLNLNEYQNGTDPRKRDTDSDGYDDGIDYAPLDNKVWSEPVNENPWYENTCNIILLILIILIILLLLITVLVLLLLRSRKKSREEEEKRRQAEALQRSMYEGQDLYSNLPRVEQPQVAPAPAPAQLPPPEQGLDDIFGGAGSLPLAAPMLQQETLPPAPQQMPPPAPMPPAGEQKTGDLSELLG